MKKAVRLSILILTFASSYELASDVKRELWVLNN